MARFQNIVVQRQQEKVSEKRKNDDQPCLQMNGFALSSSAILTTVNVLVIVLNNAHGAVTTKTFLSMLSVLVLSQHVLSISR